MEDNLDPKEKLDANQVKQRVALHAIRGKTTHVYNQDASSSRMSTVLSSFVNPLVQSV